MTGRAKIVSWVREQDSEILYNRVKRHDNGKCMSCDRMTPCICSISESVLRKRYQDESQGSDK